MSRSRFLFAFFNVDVGKVALFCLAVLILSCVPTLFGHLEVNLGYVILAKRISVGQASDAHLDKAALHFGRALGYDQTEVSAYLGLALISLQERSFDRALALVEEATKHDPRALTYMRLGEIYLTEGQYRRAIDVWLQALAPASTAMRVVQEGLRQQDTGNFQVAEELYYSAIKIAPQQSRSYGRLGKLYLDQKRLEKAKCILQQGLMLVGEGAPYSFEIVYAYGQTLMAESRAEDAVSYFELARQMLPEHQHVRTWLGRALVESGRYVEAEKQLREAVELAPSYHTFLQLGRALQGQKRYLEAERYYLRAIASVPESAPYYAAHAHLGEIYCEQGSIEKGIAELRQAIELNHQPWVLGALERCERLREND